ncbi:MAG: heavy-metal-associated domain-containing protein [Clostridia bacterium]|nr:heavy-metal-associated domain-containing protein [Clostridia bacterium]
MKLVYKMEDLECAHCAAKMEKAILKLQGVTACSISFLSQKMKLEVAEGCELSALREAISAAVRKIEPDCRVIF